MQPNASQINELAAGDTSSLDGLHTCLARLTQGPWRFIQLRGEPMSEQCIDGDDVDLLGSRPSVNLLCDAAREWVRAGLVHLWVHARKSNKLEWWFFSIDGCHVVRLDIWIELPQIDRGRSALRYDDLSALMSSNNSAIARLPLPVEASIYIHHLICKKKDLRSETVQSRLMQYEKTFHANGEKELADVASEIRATAEIQVVQEALALQRLEAALPRGTKLMRTRRGPLAWLEKLRMAWLDAPRKASVISIMGCDGAGKTTLAHAVKYSLSKPAIVFTGKHLYRKSILYKLAVIFIRPLLMRSRENFDEVLAPLVYLRASLALRLRLLFNRKPTTCTLIDRSLADFLYVNRKTDQPRFSQWGWLTRLFGKRIATVHCMVSFENVMKRKQEMTESGHETYDRQMFEHHTRRSPTNYIAFNNDGSLDESAAALAHLLKLVEESA